MKVYVDANPKELAYVTEYGESTIIPLSTVLTNNEAEYQAVLFVMFKPEWRYSNLDILSDSQLIVNQLNRKFHIKEPRLAEHANCVWQLIPGRKVTFTWIPREQNLAGKLLK